MGVVNCDGKKEGLDIKRPFKTTVFKKYVLFLNSCDNFCYYHLL